jgi:putative ABC transport system permease protein
VDDKTWSTIGGPGYRLLDHYGREIPGVAKMSVVTEPRPVISFLEGEKIVSQMRWADGPYWEILDFDFLEGGPFTAQDEENVNFVAVISEATRTKFFGDRLALNRFIEADGQRFRVIGVVGNVPLTRLTAYGDIWVPLSTAKSQGFRSQLSGSMVGLFLAESRADFSRIKAEFESRMLHVETEPPWETVLATPMTRFELTVTHLDNPDDAKPPVRKMLLMWLGMAAAFLLLPTVNLVSINLSRIIERSSEIGVRKAFGASSWDLVGQFIVENVLLCIVGSLLGLIGAVAIIEAIEASGLVPYADFRLNYRVFLYAILLGTFFGVLSGALPAWRMSRLHPVAALRGGTR